LFLAIFVVFVSFDSKKAEATISLSELQRELGVVSLMLANLSNDIQSGRITPESAKPEIQRISIVLNSLIQEASLNFVQFYPQGQVLGIFSGQGFAPPISSREAVVVLEPSYSAYSVRMNIGNSFRSTLLSFVVKPMRSDIEVRRVDVTFDKKIWRYAEEITLVAGGKTLVSIDPKPGDFFEDVRGEYTLRFGGFSYVIPRNSSRTFAVYVKPRGENTAAGELFDAKIFLNNKAVRAVDEANIQHTLPTQHGGPGGSFRREFEIVY